MVPVKVTQVGKNMYELKKVLKCAVYGSKMVEAEFSLDKTCGLKGLNRR